MRGLLFLNMTKGLTIAFFASILITFFAVIPFLVSEEPTLLHYFETITYHLSLIIDGNVKDPAYSDAFTYLTIQSLLITFSLIGIIKTLTFVIKHYKQIDIYKDL